MTEIDLEPDAALTAPARRLLAAVRFDDAGLVPAVVQDQDGTVLMVAWMNAESLARTLAERRTVFWSRSRREYWRKGDTSGHIQNVLAIASDCDQDTLLVTVRQEGPACHTGSRSCFAAGDEVTW